MFQPQTRLDPSFQVLVQILIIWDHSVTWIMTFYAIKPSNKDLGPIELWNQMHSRILSKVRDLIVWRVGTMKYPLKIPNKVLKSVRATKISILSEVKDLVLPLKDLSLAATFMLGSIIEALKSLKKLGIDRVSGLNLKGCKNPSGPSLNLSLMFWEFPLPLIFHSIRLAGRA